MAIGEDTEANPFSDWLPDKSWAELGRIGDLPPRGQDTEHELNDFRNKFKENISEWKKDRVKTDQTNRNPYVRIFGRVRGALNVRGTLK